MHQWAEGPVASVQLEGVNGTSGLPDDEGLPEEDSLSPVIGRLRSTDSSPRPYPAVHVAVGSRNSLRWLRGHEDGPETSS